MNKRKECWDLRRGGIAANEFGLPQLGYSTLFCPAVKLKSTKSFDVKKM